MTVLQQKAIPVHRNEDGELLGFIQEQKDLWLSLTIFGYVFDTAATAELAKEFVLKKGLSVLTGIWYYFDEKTDTWYPCLIKEASENQVIVVRSTEQGYLDPTINTIKVISNPDISKLKKEL